MQYLQSLQSIKKYKNLNSTKMKKIVLTLLLSFATIITNAQQVSNGRFNGNCTGNGFTAPSCIKGWESSHGSPTVLGNINANKWAWLSISKDYSDGIFSNYNFMVGKKYTISFKIKSSTTIDNSLTSIFTPKVNVRATSNLKSSSAVKMPYLIDDSELIWSKIVVKNANEDWQTIKITFIPTKNNSQIWFFPSLENKNKLNDTNKLQFELDDIEINAIKEASNNNLSIVNNSTEMDSATNYSIVPNPVYRGKVAKINSLSKNISEIQLIDLSGQSKKIEFVSIDKETVCFVLDDSTIAGIYTMNIIKKDGGIASKKLIVE